MWILSQGEFKSNFMFLSCYTDISLSDKMNWFSILVIFPFNSLSCRCLSPSILYTHVLFPYLFLFWGFTRSEWTLLWD